PAWSEQERAAGERNRQAWEAFFAGQAPSAQSGPPAPETARIAAVRAAHEAELMRYPNVVGVAEGVRTSDGRPTGEPCIVVYVTRKVPRQELRADEVLPEEIDGVCVDVVPVGEIRPLEG
ncbi:MAG TPA: hypothetical protein VEO01_19420, partial [Pseudonocardiaceae bacterium]|nr:hypothetical protein [Pseudonocardiaceae bacterium]